MAAEIDVLHGDHTTGLELVVKPNQSSPGINKVGKNKANIDQVVSVIRLRVRRHIFRPEMDVLNSESLRFLLGEHDFRTIEVDASNMSLRHHAAQRNADITTTTSHVEALRVLRERDTSQEIQRRWRHDAGKDSQSFSAFNSTSN